MRGENDYKNIKIMNITVHMKGENDYKNIKIMNINLFLS